MGLVDPESPQPKGGGEMAAPGKCFDKTFRTRAELVLDGVHLGVRPGGSLPQPTKHLLQIWTSMKVVRRETHEPGGIVRRIGLRRNPEKMHALISQDEPAQQAPEQPVDLKTGRAPFGYGAESDLRIHGHNDPGRTGGNPNEPADESS